MGQNSHENAHRLLEFYVEQLEADEESCEEALIVGLKWLGRDANAAAELVRTAAGRGAIVEIVHGLSSAMQELDSRAGIVSHAHLTVDRARRWALVIPESGVGED